MVFIRHILEEIRYLVQESEGLEYKDFVNNETLKRAFVRSLEVIGEATKNVSAEFRERCPNIKWKEMAGLRI